MALFFFSFLESTVLPIAIELILIPYMILNRRRAMAIATVTFGGCLLGALLGYAVGAELMDSVGQALIDRFGWSQGYERFLGYMDDYGFWAIAIIGIVPLPFQIAMLGAGAAHYPIVLFCAAVFLARGIRYYGLAVLVLLYGDKAQALWEEHRWATIITVLVVIALFFAASQAVAAGV